MIDLVYFYFHTLFNYLTIYYLFYLSGRGFFLLLSKIYLRQNFIQENILNIRSNILYPIVGLIITGNVLIILNFFLPLKSFFVYFVLFISIFPNVFHLNKLTFNNKFIFFVNYIFIPSVLLVSVSDINFHYDAGYYHLNHQNWLRESKIIFGMTNIFWPFGMSSIYEYISAVLWTQKGLINIHYLSIIFIHFIYSFIFFNIYESKNTKLKNASVLLLIFSVLDNFGVLGGRNGFIYIQEVTKQDTSLSILLIFTGLMIIYSLYTNSFEKVDIITLSLFSLFIIQIKVSGVIIYYLLFIYFLTLITKNKIKLRTLIGLNTIPIFFGSIWLLKNYITSGCFIYPYTPSCKNYFRWFVAEDVAEVESYTSETSFAYMQFFQNKNLTFTNWLDYFFNQNGVFSEYYKAVYTNYLISLTVILIFAFIFFKFHKPPLFVTFVIFSYVLVLSTYLIFYGPIPRYTSGLLMTSIATLAFFIKEERFSLLNKIILTSLFVVSIGLLPRLNSYINFYNNKSVALYNPYQVSNEYNIDNNLNWHKPQEGDRCWIDLECRFEEDPIQFENLGSFKVAFKISNN